MAKYAATTGVPTDRSKAELERIVLRYGGRAFVTGWDVDVQAAVVSFRMTGRHVRIRVPLPDREADEYTTYYLGSVPKVRTATESARLYEQAVRQRWRALTLIVKANLEAIELGLVDFDTVMLPWLLLPDGQTVSDHVAPQVAESYRTGQMPALLPGLPDGSRRLLKEGGHVGG